MNIRHFSIPGFVVALAALATPCALARAEVGVATPDQARPVVVAASVLEKRKTDFVVAVIAFAKATEAELAEHRNQLWQRLGTMRRALAAWDEAISGLERATSRTDEAERRIALGRAYLERGRLDDALRTLVAAEGLGPHRADLQTLLGEAYRRAGKLEKAAESFRHASMLDPKDLLSLYWLGQVVGRLGQTERAREAWRQFHDRRLELARSETVANPIGTSLAIAETPHQRLDRPSSLRVYFLRAPYRQAAALFRTARYDEAVAAFAEAASKDAVATSAFLYRSGAGDDAGRLAKLLDEGRRAVQTNPYDARRYLQLGEGYLAAGQLEEARLAFEKALELDQQLDAARLLLGHLALHAGKLDLALGYLQQTVQRRPDDVEARKLLGAALATNGRTEQALEQYRTAIRLSPDDEQPRMALASILIEARRYAEAEHELIEAAREIPDSGQAVFNLGRLYLMLGRQPEGVKTLEKSAASHPGFRRTDLYALIAGVYDTQLKSDEAVAAYLQALEANPSYVNTHGSLAHLYLRRNLYEEALAELTAILVLHPQDAEAHTKMAQTYLRMGRYGDAAEAAGRALRLRPDHRDARYALGQALLRLGRLEDGRAELRKFQKGQATNLADEHRFRDFMALQEEAIASLASGNYDKAVALFQRITEQQPHFGYWHLILARARALAGRYDEALQSLEKARELSQGSLEMHREYAEVYRWLGRAEDSERAHRAYLLAQEERRRKAVDNALR